MEMFVLSYANVLYIYPRLCLQVSSARELKFRLRTDLTNQYVNSDIVLLISVNETIYMVICFYTRFKSMFYGPG